MVVQNADLKKKKPAQNNKKGEEEGEWEAGTKAPLKRGGAEVARSGPALTCGKLVGQQEH